MKFSSLPLLTLGLCLLCCLLFLLPAPMQALLYFDAAQLQQGNPVGLLSGHLLHADGQHLLWNVLALALLGAVVELRSRRLLLLGLLAGALSVDLLLLGPGNPLQRYCGLSGVLNTLYGLALYLLWRERPHPLILGAGAAAIGKIALEWHSGQSVFTTISWPAYVPAHLAGLLGTLPLVWLCRARCQSLTNQPGRIYGNLVTGK